MSKINDLIKKMCPNGVRFDRLENVTLLQAGDRITTAMMSDDFQYDVIGGGTLPTGKYNDYNREHCITISRAGSAGYVNWMENKFWATDVCFTAIKNNDYMNIKFIYHYLKNAQKDLQQHIYGGSMPKLEKLFLWKYPIPIPPLAVQEEIVRILDKFSELEAKLEKELEKELEIRKSQYEFWREGIFNNVNGEKIKLRDVCIIGDGLHGTPHYVDESEYYFINGNNLNNGEITYDNKTKKISKVEFDSQNILLNNNTLLMSINGTIGKVAYYNNEKIMLGKSVAYFNIVDTNELSRKYLYYLLQSPNSIKYYQDSLTGSTILNLGLKALREFEVIIPSIDEQNRISNCLEHFDKLINDISECLSSEVELRRQQYEYYRNKLLSFEKLNG